MDISTLQSAVRFYHQQSLTASTHKLYNTGIHRYLTFCQGITHTPMLTSELTLLLFVPHLAQSHLSYSTIRVYLFVVRHLYLTTVLLDTFSAQSTPRLAQVLQRIKRYQACTTSPTIHLPITIQIMHNIKATLAQSHTEYQNIMMWAACCVAFFGCLCCSEFTAEPV